MELQKKKGARGIIQKTTELRGMREKGGGTSVIMMWKGKAGKKKNSPPRGINGSIFLCRWIRGGKYPPDGGGMGRECEKGKGCAMTPERYRGRGRAATER